MKLVNLERIKNYIQTQINPYGKPFKGTAYEFGIKLLDYLNNKDADYDVEKVVEELRNEKEFWNDATYNKEIGKQKARSYAYAIEIVQSNGFLKTTLKNNNGWIPCSERLPEEGVPVNITYKNSNPPSYYIKNIPFTATAISYKNKWYWYSCICLDILNEYGKNEADAVNKDIDIIAWQPLPEPYSEE